MKIDLHLHTEHSSSNGDTLKWLGVYKALTTLVNHKIGIASFTDHNIFRAKLYTEARDLGQKFITVLPGIEVNVVRHNGMIGHMLILFEETLNDNQLHEIETISKSILKSGVSINNINNLFNEFNTIRIIHIGKNDYFSIEDLNNLKYDAFEISNLQHPNYLKITKEGISSSVVAFSDTHLWDEYPQHNKLITKIDGLEPTFKSLKHHLSLNQVYVIENE